ncbi:hydrogenase nickel incorporation protein HypB [Actinacidiphila yeochonensis]|uniref:hydrogenase nickel incorporation protein HypB n=1 Tax=Actinacidiphila yeochonensis TaxID=89050 RepID=UPI00099B400F|nr:hydrogenase nickel incorporation protein HypB [Actinacidiphila yeochonensis]
MCRTDDLRTAVLGRNDRAADVLRAELAARGTVLVNLLSSPGSGKTALLEAELALAGRRGVPVAALTADLATENDATRLARSGAPVRQVLTDGLCHLETDMLRGHLDGWLPPRTRLLFVENVGNLVCPASYDLGETLRVVLASVTEGEDKPLKYPTAFGLAHLVVITKEDIAAAVGFDRDAFLANVHRVNPGVEVVSTSARGGQGVGLLLDRALAAGAGGPVHRPVMATALAATGHGHAHGNGHGLGNGNGNGPVPGGEPGPGPASGPVHDGPQTHPHPHDHPPVHDHDHDQARSHDRPHPATAAPGDPHGHDGHGSGRDGTRAPAGTR